MTKTIDEILPQLIIDLVWSASDGGYRLTKNQLLSYQEEPLQEYEAIKDYISQELQDQKLVILKSLETYFGHIQNDGQGKPMNISLDEIIKDIMHLPELS